MLMLLPLACAVVLGGIYVFATEASGWSKFVVLMLVGASLVLRFAFPSLWLPALLIQVVVSLGILLYLKVK